MPRIKIKVERGNGLQQVITVDTDATKGARLGTDLYMPNGQVATPESTRVWLGLSAEGNTGAYRPGYGIVFSGGSPKTISVDRTAAFAWTGQHQWTQALWGPNGSAAAPAFTFTGDPDTGVYNVGADNLGIATGGTLRWDVDATRTFQNIPVEITQVVEPSSYVSFLKLSNLRDPSLVSDSDNLWVHGWDTGTTSGTTPDKGFQVGFWKDIPTTIPPTAAGSGFRFNFGGLQNTPSGVLLSLYVHNSSAAGQEVYRHRLSSAQMLFAAGSEGAPTVAMINDPTTGFWSSGAGNLRASAAGSEIFAFSTTHFVLTRPVSLTDGSAGTPALRFNSDQNTGIFSGGADVISFSTGGTNRLSIEAAQIAYNLPLRGPNGSAGAPAFSFSGDNNTGIYNVGADNLGISAGGTLRWDINTTRINSTLPWRGPAGSAGTPTFSFSGDPNTGIYNVGADQLGIAANGVLVGQFDADATAGNTRFLVYDVDNATLERVSVGAADSGGAGFKVLRIPN